MRESKIEAKTNGSSEQQNGHAKNGDANGHSDGNGNGIHDYEIEKRLEELEQENQVLKSEKSKIRELLKVAQEAENWKLLSENLNEKLNLKVNGDD